MNVIQKILSDYYEVIEYSLKPRPVVLENIDKVIHCGDSSYGGAMFSCPHCGEFKFVPFRCHSRFCKVTFFSYSYLRKAFQTVLLNILEQRIGPSFKSAKSIWRVFFCFKLT